MDLQPAIEKTLQGSKKRKFVQSVDILISLKDIDLKKTESKFVEEVVLPNGRGKDPKIGIFASAEMAEKAKGLNLTIIPDRDIEKLGKDKRQVRKIVGGHDFFISEPDFMIRIGKAFGMAMGPKGKMPKPIPPGSDPTIFYERFRRAIRIKLREQPMVQATIGMENMDPQKLAQNADAVLSAVKRRMPNGDDNIRGVFFKTTMGQLVRVE
ncbi:MAG: 50S ribosomal protein L1 [archaeon]